MTTPPTALPADFVETITDLYGEDGGQWLARLPALRAEYARRWSLRLGDPYELSHNYVAPAELPDGTAAVLKLSPPGNPELPAEAAALALAAGRGVVRLLDSDLTAGALLLERAEPGDTLTTLVPHDDATAVSAAATVMRRYWRPVPDDHPFPTVTQWRGGFTRLRDAHAGGTGPFPGALVTTAERTFDELLASAADPVVLHGDLHHDNILRAEREPWLAIDPKGVIGEPAYEVGALLRNPSPQLLDAPDPAKLLARRLDQFADELDLGRERLRGWAHAQAVLAAIWVWEDHGEPWDFALHCAALLATA